jgi:hypothetical protein
VSNNLVVVCGIDRFCPSIVVVPFFHDIETPSGETRRKEVRGYCLREPVERRARDPVDAGGVVESAFAVHPGGVNNDIRCRTGVELNEGPNEFFRKGATPNVCNEFTVDEPERRAFVTGWPYPFRPERADLLRDEEVREVRDRE